MLVQEGLSQVWGWALGWGGVQMSALPTPRSGYSKHNSSGEKPGLALPVAFSPIPPPPTQGSPFPEPGLQDGGTPAAGGKGKGQGNF